MAPGHRRILAFHVTVREIGKLLGGRPVPGFLGHAGLAHHVQCFGELFRQLRHVRPLFLKASAHSAEREFAGGQFIDGYTQRPDVTGLDRLILLAEPLRAHIGDGPRGVEFHRTLPERRPELLADTEVRDDILAILVDQDVVRLDILVDDGRLLAVQIGQSGGDIVRETPELILRHLAGELRYRPFRAERHHQERTPVFRIHTQIVGMQEVGMVQLEGELEFLLEILQSLLVHRHIDLRGHFHVRRLVGGDPDFTETAAADIPFKLVSVIE